MKNSTYAYITIFSGLVIVPLGSIYLCDEIFYNQFGIDFFDDHMIFVMIVCFVIWFMTCNYIKKFFTTSKDNITTVNEKHEEIFNDINIYKEVGVISDIANITNLINQTQQNTIVDSTNELLKLYLQRGKIYNYINKQDYAINDFVIVKTMADKLSNTELVNIASQQYKENNYVDALFFYSIIIDKKDCIKEKDIPETYYTMALICIELKQIQTAKKILQIAIDKAKAYSQTLSYVEVEDYQNKRINKYLKALNILNTQKTKYCSYCGEPVDENATVCSLCNQPLNQEQMQENTIIGSTDETHELYVQRVKIYNCLKNILIKKQSQERKNEIINLETCTKEDLLTLAGFDETKADKFISERNSGKQYYDIDSLVAEFEIQPHEMIEIESRLIFAQRPKSKVGRRVDW